MSKDGMRRRRRRRILHWAQGGRCAGCGRGIGWSDKGPKSRPLYPTFDHFRPKHAGGSRALSNGLLKHRSCNMERADRPPTACDRLWLAVVEVRLASAAGQALIQLPAEAVIRAGR